MSDNDVAKLLGKLEFDLDPVRANMQQLDRYVDRISRMGEKAEKSFNRMGMGQDWVKQQDRHINQLEKQTKRLGDIQGQLSNRLQWYVSGTMFYGAGAIFGNIVKQISDVEAGMIRIQKVMNDTTVNLDEMRDKLLELGTQYGVLAQDVLNSAQIWAQAGYKADEIITLTETSLKAMLVAELNSEEAVRLLISTLKQFNLTAEESAAVVDKVNQVSNDFAVSSGDLLNAIAVSGQVYKDYGVTLDQLIGYTTALAEATGRSGKEIGNALRSIAVYSHRDKAIGVFEQYIGEVQTAEGEFRDLDEILAELAKRWDSFTDAQRNEIAQAAAGNRRRNYFISLMNGMATAVDATTTSLDSLGSAEREAALYMEAYERKVAQLYAALQRLAVSVGEAHLLDLLKGLVDSTRAAVEAFEDLPPVIKDAIIIFTGLSAALTGVSLASRTFMGTGIGYYLIRLAARIGKVEAATLSLSAAFKILAANPTGRLITLLGGLAAAVALYKKNADAVQQTTQQNTAAMMQENAERERQIGILKKAINRREELIKALESEKLSEEQVKQAKQELNDVSELTKLILGEEAAARLEAAGYTKQAIREELKAFEGKAQAEKEALEHTVEQQIKQTEAVIENAEQRIKALEAEGAAISGLLALERDAASIGAGIYNFQASTSEKAATFFDRIGLEGLAETNRNNAEYWRSMVEEREKSYQEMVEAKTEEKTQKWKDTLLNARSELLDLKGKALDLSGITGTLGTGGLVDDLLGDDGGSGGSGASAKNRDRLAFLNEYEKALRNIKLEAAPLSCNEHILCDPIKLEGAV